MWESVKSWFGFKLHLIVDANYELPVDYKVTKASASDIAVGRDMVKDLALNRPEVLENARWLLADSKKIAIL